MNQEVSQKTGVPTGAILAGGKSKRMGQPKANIRLWDGRTMLEHILDALLALCPRVVVVGADCSRRIEAGSRVVHLPDRKPGLGPLSGLDALLSSELDEGYLIAACDQPLLSFALLQRLTEGDPNHPHFFRATRLNSFLPLPAYFPSALLPDVQRILSSPDHSLRALAAAASPQWIEISAEEERLLTSINTPAQLAEINQCMREYSRAY